MVRQVPVRSKKNVYRRLIEFEEQAAEIYLRLASRFSTENPKLSAVWLAMAIEEKQHAGLLQFCLSNGLFATDVPLESELRKYAELFRSLKNRAAAAALSLDEAFELAAELEGSEVNAIYCRLTTPVHASSYLLKQKIVTSPLAHI